MELESHFLEDGLSGQIVPQNFSRKFSKVFLPRDPGYARQQFGSQPASVPLIRYQYSRLRFGTSDRTETADTDDPQISGLVSGFLPIRHLMQTRGRKTAKTDADQPLVFHSRA